MTIRERRKQGLTKTAAALRLGLDGKTVAKYWDGPADDPEEPRFRQCSKMTDPYLKYITERLDASGFNRSTQVSRIKKRGYTDARRSEKPCVAGLREKEKTYREYRPWIRFQANRLKVTGGHCGKTNVDGQKIPFYAFLFSIFVKSRMRRVSQR